MKKYIMSHMINLIIAGALFLTFWACQIACTVICQEPASQKLSDRWGAGDGYHQLSVFFSDNAAMTTDKLTETERTIRKKLEDSSVLAEGKERIFISAYSTIDNTTISSEKTRGENVRVVAVGGDYFKFHPYEIISGGYFDPTNDENSDGLIIDSLVAWKLFGGMDCAGMTVDIGGRAYVVRGVVQTDEERFSETVGEDDATIFMSFEAYKKMKGTDVTVNIGCYETLIKNPVKNFAYNTLRDALGGSETPAEGWDKDFDLVNNTTRYRFTSRVARIGTFFTQTMNTKLIIYPYWENRARGYEQIGMMFAIAQLMLLVYPSVWLVLLIIQLVKRRDTVISKIKALRDKLVRKYRDYQNKKWLEKHKEENTPNIEEQTHENL